MVDDKPLHDQIHEFQDYARHMQIKEYIFNKEYKVACLTDKVTPLWNKFVREL